MKNIELEDKKLSFEPCMVEVVHFGEDIILTSGESVQQDGDNEKTDGEY